MNEKYRVWEAMERQRRIAGTIHHVADRVQDNETLLVKYSLLEFAERTGGEVAVVFEF